jgi:hypothetical protein
VPSRSPTTRPTHPCHRSHRGPARGDRGRSSGRRCQPTGSRSRPDRSCVRLLLNRCSAPFPFEIGPKSPKIGDQESPIDHGMADEWVRVRPERRGWRRRVVVPEPVIVPGRGTTTLRECVHRSLERGGAVGATGAGGTMLLPRVQGGTSRSPRGHPRTCDQAPDAAAETGRRLTMRRVASPSLEA